MTQPDPSEALFRLVELQSRLLTDALTALARVNQPQQSPVSQLKELVEILQLATPAPAPTAAPPDTPAVIAGGPVWLPVVDRAITALERINARPAAIAAPAAAAPSPETIKVPRWLAPIIPYIGVLCNWADAGVRPELRATIVAEELDATQRALLAEMLTAEGFPLSIISSIPDFHSREAWFIPFLYALRSAIVPPAIAAAAESADADGDSAPAAAVGSRRNGAER